MVEYAILVAGTALRSLSADVSNFAADVSNFAADLNWAYIGYAAVLLVALRIAFWAFRTSR